MYPSMPLLMHSTRDSLHREVHYSDLSTKKNQKKKKRGTSDKGNARQTKKCYQN